MSLTINIAHATPGLIEPRILSELINSISKDLKGFSALSQFIKEEL
jgi:hypothetical protein